MTLLADWGTEPTPQALQAVLQQGLPGFAEGRMKIESLRVLKMRRSSSKRRHPHPLTVCLDMEVHELANARRGVQRLYGKTYREGASAAAYAQALQAAVSPAAFGAPLAHLPAQDMLCWAWPNDPGLPQLPTLLDPRRLQAHLPAGCAQGAVVTEVQALRYEPERRATLQCRLSDGRLIYGKTFCDEHGATVLARFEQAWARAAQDAGAATVAQPLGFDRATRSFWQAAAPGLPLVQLSHAQAEPALQRLGLALARLHAVPMALGAAEHTVAHWLDEAQGRAKKIARVAPELGGRAMALVVQLTEAAAQLPALPLSLVHGDFHPEQVWVHEGRPLLFDFDEFALGHPMEDLAAFVTKMQQRGLPQAECAAGTHALLQGYRQAAPQRWQPLWLQWHLTVQALLQTSRAFVFQVPGWPEEVARRLALAEACAQVLQEQLA